jgi:Domain of unknown function (DUF2017)
MSREPFAPTEGGNVEVRLSPDLIAVLDDLCDQLEALLKTRPRTDPAVSRLFPAAYPDDPLRELEFERMTADDLSSGRLAALRRMRATLRARVLDAEDSDAWLRTLNDIRLVIGGRLEVTEESRPEDFADDEIGAETFDLYDLLGEVQGLLLRAIDPSAVEPPED